MNVLQSLAISLGTILLLSGILVTANAQPKVLTFLTLDPIPSEVASGDEVSFTGTLTTGSGAGLAGMTIRIIEESPTESIVLATAVTDENGAYAATWNAELKDPQRDRIMTIIAAFAGQDKYSAAKTGTTGLTVAIQKMKVVFTFDKRTYFSGDVATFTIKFSSPVGLSIAPESIRAIYDGRTVNLTRQSEGVYIYKTPALTPPTHTLQIIAEKHGYKLFNDATTITVFARQVLPTIRLDFSWSPKPVMQGTAASFALAFADINNVVAPFVNYDFVIKKGKESVLDLKGEQTLNGTAVYTHTFADVGKYKVTVKINGMGQAPDLTPITQSFDFDIDVIKAAAFSVKVKAMQKGDALRIAFRNPTLATTSVYTLHLIFEDPSKVKVRAPSGWELGTDADAIVLTAGNSPIEPGKDLRLRIKAQGTVDSFDWKAMDKFGNELKSGTAKVRQIKLR